MSRVIVGMSGGVDSAVTAYLLKLAGYEVIGVTLRVWQTGDGKDSRCCEIDDARRVSAKLGIEYMVVNCMSDFNEKVTRPFVCDYVSGVTPNPCIECNRYVKWAKMLEVADNLGAQYIATGHYAHIVKLDNGRMTVKKADFAAKDQTYMLYRLTQEQLSRTLMPLGKLSKDEVREIARKAQLPVAEKADSQEICFVTEGDYAEYVEENFEGDIPEVGNFVDTQGNVLGKHKGIIHYTIGQRKGLGVAFGTPMYVKEIRADKNEVVLCDNETLFSKTLKVNRVNFMSIPPLEVGEEITCNIKVRYHHKEQRAVLKMVGKEEAEIVFDEPVRAICPGQSAVFYDDEEYVVGGGIIVI